MSPAIRRVVGSFRLCSRRLSSAGGSADLDRKKDASYALKRFIVDKIRATGPITVAEYMKTSVSAPTIGYYGGFSDSQKVFGKGGDFITAPELTQLFGELLGVWCYHELANTGHHGPWQLVECGPGTGQLMSDILSVLDNFQEKNLSVHLVECSDALIEQQERQLCGGLSSSSGSKESDSASYVKKGVSKSGVPIYWYKALDDIPEQFSVFVANEFFDALPVHQFSRDSKGTWNEVYVNIDEANELCFMRSKGENLHTRGLIPDTIRQDRQRIHWDAALKLALLSTRLRKGLYTMVVLVSSLIMVTMVPVIACLLEATRNMSSASFEPTCAIDLTADVDFGYLKSLVSDRAAVYGPQTQREFLGQMGIELRLRRLLKSCNDREKQEALIKSYNYLMGNMGERFMAISIFPRTLSGILEKRGGPAGFAVPHSPSKCPST